MSLDVTLTIGSKHKCNCEFCTETEVKEVYDANITNNLGKMADAAGIYKALWRPYQLKKGYNIPEGKHTDEYEYEEKTHIVASFIIPYLEKGLADLKARPEYFETFNSENGWGLYKHFVPFVEKYLDACKMYPNAKVTISR